MAVIGGFRFDLSITCKTDGNYGNVSAGVVLSMKTVVKIDFTDFLGQVCRAAL